MRCLVKQIYVYLFKFTFSASFGIVNCYVCIFIASKVINTKRVRVRVREDAKEEKEEVEKNSSPLCSCIYITFSERTRVY